MIKLIVNNSECQVQGLSVAQLKALRGLLSYELPTQPGSLIRRASLVSPKGTFATGLLEHALNHLNNCSIVFDIQDLRKAPKASPGRFKAKLGVTPYADQTNAIEVACSSIRGIVSATTGVGKSLMMAMLIQRLQLKTLIVVPNLGLRTQLRESMRAIFGSLDNITIENIDSTKLKTAKDYDLLLIDECHHVAAKTYRTLNKKAWSGIYHRYCFTATPFRSRDEEQLLFESIAGQVLYEIDYRTAVANNYIVGVEAYFVEVPTTKIKGNPKSWPSMYSELVVNNDPRNQIIADLLKNLQAAGKAAICLVKEVKHGDHLVKLTGLPFMHGEAENNRTALLEFLLQESPVLIGTTGVLAEGVDTKPAEFVIIAGLGKSRPQLMQMIGRAVRNYPGKESAKIILILDRSHAWTKSHFKEQCKTLLDVYGIVPSRIQL